MTYSFLRSFIFFPHISHYVCGFFFFCCETSEHFFLTKKLGVSMCRAIGGILHFFCLDACHFLEFLFCGYVSDKNRAHDKYISI